MGERSREKFVLERVEKRENVREWKVSEKKKTGALPHERKKKKNTLNINYTPLHDVIKVREWGDICKMARKFLLVNFGHGSFLLIFIARLLNVPHMV